MRVDLRPTGTFQRFITIGSRASVFAASALLAAGTFSPAAEAAASPHNRFAIAEGGRATIAKPAVRPLGANLDRKVTVVVTLGGDSVAAVRARSLTHQISDTERRSVHESARAAHSRLRPSIEGFGGRVIASYSSALNGMKVEISARELANLRQLPGVTSVLRVPVYRRENAVSVPYLGAPQVWQATPGYRGEHVKVAIIDTGIDYTHANFGGPGTPEAFMAAFAASTAPANPALFGPSAPKVKGGIDLVGDAYDADDPTSVPVPDPNPLDCNGHGSHVAGTTAGYGVTNAGATYTGPYNAAAYASKPFSIGPGVAPKADLYAVRVFGCNGSTNVVTDALDWAVANDMDVVNMSLGSAYGTGDSSDALAADNAAKAGVTVVASAGNSGPAPYISGAPGSGTRVIAVGAIDGTESFPGATIALSGGTTINAMDANDVSISKALDVVVLRNPDGSVSLGCNEAEYVDGAIAGKLVVTKRGNCNRTDRAIFGARHGAAAVALINNAAGYGIFEGTIPGVGVPFLAVQPSDAPALTAAASASIASGSTVPNAQFEAAASFSSGGPRYGDSFFKPAVTAPGVAINSTLVGSGSGSERLSGTSMAAPHVAGVAALTRQAHPNWSERQIAAAIVETSSPGLTAYNPRLQGAGVVQPADSTRTQVVALTEDGNTGLSFGFEESTRDIRDSQTLKIRNLGRGTARFNVSSTPAPGSPHTITVSRSSLSISGGEDTSLKVSINVPVATVGDSSRFRQAAGFLTLTPVGASNNGVALTVPYYLVPRARSQVSAELSNSLSPRSPSATVQLRNSSAVYGSADFYAWGLSSLPQGMQYFDTRAVGVQAFPWSATDNLMVFAINSYTRFSAASRGEWDIYIDSNGDGIPDYDVFALDFGLLTTGSFNGTVSVGVLNLATNSIVVNFNATTSTDGSTLFLPVLTSDVGLSAANPRFSYQQLTFDLLDGSSTQTGSTAAFNAFTPAISNGDWADLAGGTAASVPVSINPAEWAKTPALGVMVVAAENSSGASQARLLNARH